LAGGRTRRDRQQMTHGPVSERHGDVTSTMFSVESFGTEQLL
jgi:hypothetical protein